MVGAAIVRRLGERRLRDPHGRSQRARSDATSATSSAGWTRERPQAVFVAAAKVGGILANDDLSGRVSPAKSRDRSECHRGAARIGVEKLLFLGSSCIYPKLAPQPIPEDALLTGPLEPTNEWYAIAKIAGIKLCQAYRRQYGCDFISAMPTNLYGPGDNYRPYQQPRAPGTDPQGA